MTEVGWNFESNIVTPSGVRITVAIAVPDGRAWDDVLETTEIAQMCAARAVNMIRTSSQRGAM